MSQYIITGEYPAYTITDNDGNEDYASDMGSIMKRFTWKLEPGDTIHWEAS
jgi:hypothetical protein